MAKSTGNIARVGGCRGGVLARALRYALISVHYRAPLDRAATIRCRPRGRRWSGSTPS